jgi:hypothetical protein
MNPTVPTLLAIAVTALGLIWLIWSDVAPIGFAFLLTGLCLLMLSNPKE